MMMRLFKVLGSPSNGLSHVLCLLALCVCVTACGKEAPSPAPSEEGEAALVSVPGSEIEDISPGGDEDAAPVTAEGDLTGSCMKLITCCDAWVTVTPSARVGCNAQRQAFRAAKTPEARAKLGGLCEQALSAWVQLPNIPDVCK